MAKRSKTATSPGRKYPGYWTIKSLRKGLRNRVSRWLTRYRSEVTTLMPLDPATIRRVIVCRRNRRLGNMLMLTPLLRSLSAAMPHAEIDLLIGNEDFAGLFRGLAGVRKVWVMPSRGWGWPWRMLRMLLKLRDQHYDLSIEPSINSFSNRLSARLCGARFTLGFNTPDQWLRLTHAVNPDPAIVHDALIPVQLVRDGIRGATLMQSHLHIALTDEERAAGQARLRQALGDSQGPVVGFFTEATGKKRLPRKWWRRWSSSMTAQQCGIRLLQILPPGNASALRTDIPSVQEPDHRTLAALLSQLDLFVSCDAGPMHLAGAAGTPTIGLFCASKSHRYRPLGKASLALEVAGLDPGKVARAVAEHLQVILSIVSMTQAQFPPRRTGSGGPLPATAKTQVQAPNIPQAGWTTARPQDN